MRKQIIFTLVSILSLSSLALRAQTTPTEKTGTALMGLNYQVQEFQLLNQNTGNDCNCLEGNRLNKRSTQSINLSVFKFKQNWAWNATLGYGFGYAMDDNKAYTKVSLLQTRVDAFYHFLKTENRLRPFVGAGVQWAFNANTGLLSIPVGAGLRYRLNSGAYLHWQTAFDYGLADNLAKNLITQIGVHFPLGKTKPAKETEPSKAIAAKPVSPESPAVPAPESAKSAVSSAPADTTAKSVLAASDNNGKSLENGSNKSDQPVNNSIISAIPTAQQAAEPQLAKVVYFDTDKWSLNKAGTDVTLMEVLAFAKTYPQTVLSLSGHTDSVLNQAYNLALSKRRVEAVKSWLMKNGVGATRIKIAYSGKISPASSNETEEGRAANRRVEIHIK